MNIRQQLVQLSEVGNLDSKLLTLKEKENALPQKAETAKAKAADLSGRLATIKSKHTETLSKRRKLDVDLQNERNNLRKWESRADQIRGDREYAALMSEIGGLKRTISNIESDIIEDMQALEDAEKEMAKIEKLSEQATAEADEEWNAVSAELEEIRGHISEHEKAKQKLLDELPKTISKRYQMIASRRGGIGVAVVKREVCQGCMRAVPPELFNRVAKAEVIEQCPYCNRYLVTEALPAVETDTN